MKINFKSIIIKLIVVLSVLAILFGTFSTVFSEGDGNFNPSEFDNGGVSSEVDNLVQNSAGTTVAVLRVVSVAIAIIVLLVIAMKYMISSAGDRADIKKHAVAYVIGTFILFSAAQIIALLIDIADKTFSTTTPE